MGYRLTIAFLLYATVAEAAYIIPTPQPTATPMNTPVPTATVVPTATPANTPVPTATAISTPTPLTFGTNGVISIFAATQLGSYVGSACPTPQVAISIDGTGALGCASVSVTPIPTATPYTAYDTIQEEGVGLTQRRTLNIIGAYSTCADNSGSSKTDCTWVTPTPQPTATPPNTPVPTATIVPTATPVSAWYAGASNGNMNTGVTTYIPILGGDVAATGTETNISQIAGFTGTVRNLRCKTTLAPTGATKSWTFTFRVNAASPASGPACTITDTATSCTDLSNTAAVTAGDRLAVQVVPANTPGNSGGATCSIQVDP